MTPSVRPTRNIRLLLGFLVKAEVDAIFKQQPFELSDGGPDPLNAWRSAAERVRRLPPTPANTEIGLLEESEVTRQVKSRATFARYYDAVDDYQFALLRIGDLLTPQFFADVDYIEELSMQIEEGASLDDQLRFTMTEGRITEPITCGSQLIFNSTRPDLHVDSVPVFREVGGGEFEVVIRGSSRPNYVQAAAIGGRVLLTNGVHHVCALSRRGYTHVPCLLRRVGRIEEAGLNLQSSLFRPEVFAGARPAHVLDLMNPDVAVAGRMRSMSHVVRVGIGIESITIPAIPGSHIPSPAERDKSGPTLGPVDDRVSRAAA